MDIFLPVRQPRKLRRNPPTSLSKDNDGELEVAQRTREKFRKMLKNGKLDDREVEIETQVNSLPVVEIFSPGGMEEMDINLKDMMSNFFPGKTKKKTG